MKSFTKLVAVAPTRWDVWVLLRSTIITALALGVAWLVAAATDEGGVTWGERAGRTLPLAPACAAIGAGVALAPVRARGEALALAALGRSPAQVGAAAVIGGALVAFAASLAIGAASAVDVTAFFPHAARATAWTWENGSFIDRSQGLRVGPDGAPIRFAREMAVAMAILPRLGRVSAATATALAGLALPLLAAHALLDRPVSSGSRGTGKDHLFRERAGEFLVATIAIASSLALFQAAAIRHSPAALAVIPPLALLAFALRRYRSP